MLNKKSGPYLTKECVGKYIVIFIFSILCINWMNDSASADILFVDLNISPKEVEAAKKAAQERGENLIVIPNPPEEIKHAVITINQDLQDLEIKRKQLAGDLTSSTPELRRQEAITALSKITKTEQTLIDNRTAMLAPYQIKPKHLSDKILELDNNHRSLTTIILSSHSRGNLYWGLCSINNLEQVHLLAILNRHPNLKNSLRSVLLWGCYTVVPEEVLWWKKHFPNLKLLLGFSESGPSGAREQSSELLLDALRKERHMEEQTQLKKALGALKELRHAEDTGAAAMINSCYVSTLSNSRHLPDLTQDCKQAQQLLKQQLTTYQKYFDASSGYEYPPSNTHTSKLRVFYNMIQKYEHCRQDFTSPLPSREQVLALIFFQSLKKNFGVFYSNEIRTANRFLKKLNAPHDVRFPDFFNDALTRAQVLESLKKLHSFLEQKQLLHADNKSSSELGILLQVYKQTQILLKDLKCVPPQWLTQEPTRNSRPIHPRC
jgi:hypothetical protein